MVEKKFPATDEALADVLAFVEEELEMRHCPAKIVMQITVCMEEMFVNIAHYAYGDTQGEALLRIDDEEDMVSFTLIDEGIPFDPLAKEDPDITLSAEERAVGGLGIYMVKMSMDKVSYERRGDQNVFTMAKRIR